ncbi:hypothetical protein HDE68_004113 [Pedobacter cryoconitis]|uniref:DUF4836 family protein n=1 Tax=Pedobacter cryoconitis TaxID=188932 RepID=A0A7W8ZQ92_9SPHI|nr:hypothetical protein [Pedobacter cryoconitis]MBB5638187.1 hypothetical protein [Pedobacter cryoconitis]
MNLYKYTITAIFSITALGVSAQDLVHHIPAEAKAVVTLKGGNLIQLMSVKEFNNTFAGKKITEELAKAAKGDLRTIEDFGFNLSSTFYYYNQSNDSVSYNCLLAPVKNAAQVDELFKKADKKFTLNDKLRAYHNYNSTEVVYWNDEMFLFVKSAGKEAYFLKPEVSKRLGLPVVKEFGLADTTATASPAYNEATDYVVEVESPPYMEVPQPVKRKKTVVRKHKNGKVKINRQKYKTAKKYPKRKPVKKIVIIDEELPKEENYETGDSTAYAGTNGYMKEIDTAVVNADHRIREIKDAKVESWTREMVAGFFAGDNHKSILSNKDFVKSRDEKAEISAWIPSTEHALLSFLPVSIFKGLNVFKGYGSASMNLYLEKNDIRIGSSLTLSDEMATAFAKINKRKVNKKFLNYVNEDKFIGYMAYAMDSKAYLEEYPKLMNKMYGSVYKDEVSMASDLFSLLLDEEAVSKVIKGDGLLIFNGLTQKEVTYKTYEYNEDNFERDTVTKTKMETRPDFLFMLSTGDTRLLDKLIAYGVKKNVVKDMHNYYELITPKNPMPVYFAIHNGIIFMGSDGQEIGQIVNNKYQGKISSRHKNEILKNNFAAYFNSKRMAGKIPYSELGSPQKLEKTNKILNSLGDIYIKSAPVKGNVFSGEISMDIPAKEQNALKYLFSIIEDVEK